MIYRCDTLDALRLFFAFCVVLIHVPMLGGGYLEPIYRCAVPFFYVISGYFISGNSSFDKKLLCSSKEWLVLFVKYFIIVSALSVFLHVVLSQVILIDFQDIAFLFIEGNIPQSLDVLKVDNQEVGLFVHWFLIGGGYGFIILFILRKFLEKPFFYVIFLVLYVVCLSLTIAEVKVFRWLCLSVPYIALGFFIQKNQDRLLPILVNRLSCFVYILAIAEWLMFRYYEIHVESYFLTPLVVAHIFLLSLTLKIGDNSRKLLFVISSLGRDHSLNIYIYHRFIFAVLLLLCGENIIPFAAPFCFLTTLCCSIIYKYASSRH